MRIKRIPHYIGRTRAARLGGGLGLDATVVGLSLVPGASMIRLGLDGRTRTALE